MFPAPRPGRVLASLLVVALPALILSQPPAAKRPLTHADYEGWRTVQQPVVSRDGQWFAYNLMPGDADGEFVVRHLQSGKEHRLPRGRSGSPTAPAGNPTPGITEFEADDDQPPARPGRTGGGGTTRTGTTDTPNPLASAAHVFSPDNKSLVFALVPTKAEVDKAKQDKKPEADMPRPVLAILDLASGKVTSRIDRATSFQVVGDAAGMLVYRRAAKPTPMPEKKDDKPAGSDDDQPPATQQPPRTTTRAAGTDLVIRNLADGSERTIPDVTEFSLTKDNRLLVIATSSTKAETNGVFAIFNLPGGEAIPLATGKGRYSRLTWDEKQSRLAFFTDRDDAAAPRPKARIYTWDRSAKVRMAAEGAAAAERPANAAELLTLNPPGIRAGWSIVERGSLTLSADGTKLYVSTAPDAKPQPPAAGKPEDSAVFDLWHWKDALIQPMQKARGATLANRSFRAVYFIADKLFRHLSEENVEVTPMLEGDWAISSDSRPYRMLTGYGATLADYALVNMRTGQRRPLLQASPFAPIAAHDGKNLAYFDGANWHGVSVADGKRVNLTGKLAVKFVNEDWDQPSEAPAYGFAGWTSDAKFVLLYDRFDIWKAAIDGTSMVNLTAGVGRKNHTQLRVSRSGPPTFGGRTTGPGAPPTPGGNPATSEEPQRGTDLAKPLLLKAVNELTRDEGFYRVIPGQAEPKLLVMGPRSYGSPIKAKDSETQLVTISTFSDAPNYFATSADFKDFKKVTSAYDKQAQFTWGKAELVRYKNLDGVELSGMLVKPDNFDPMKKYPMLVYIYERLSQNLHRFVAPNAGTSINPTFYASNGYLVFMPDIAYTVGTPGQSALKCVLPAIQSIVDKGYVDEKAIGIQGHSWGGYQIAYMITQTTRFKAAAAGAPVSNMVSAYDGIRWGTGLPRQFQYERSQSRIGATLWQAPQKFIENSPIFMADRVQTPLLMLHNDNDDAVPWYQGIEYYLALRRLGKECYMFNYVGEPHGLRKRANQKDYTVRMQEFFDHHLKGAPMPEWMAKGIPYKPREGDRPTTPTAPMPMMEQE